MYVSETGIGTPFKKGQIKPYGSIALEPAATVLNYGQGLFEGMKVLRTASGRCVLFRPEKNAERAAGGCERLLMSPIPKDVFLDGVVETARANSHWIPPAGQGALYLRPVIFGSGPSLGVAPSDWYHFIVYASPVGAYFKGGASSGGVALEVSSGFHRAAPKGVGNVKSISNYAPAYQAQSLAKKAGFADALFLDTTDTLVEEAGAANFFVVDKSGTVRTPALGSILPGVTRESVLTLARDLGLRVQEGPLPIAEVMEAKEAWCTGTAAVISPVGSVTYKGKKKEFAAPDVSKKIYKLFDAILEGKEADKHGWVVDLYA
jgi:branched-chain amino acid aminotransferase